ncbi:hypothetical protein [Bacillus sp. MUM 13]|uniref:hypothetical protein n=1 Tax=Bacillus sp. MUM 13 TaxID=1678001 RepID=UPI0008F5B1DD|nr:hypothetical protein BIV59_17400 [Bacillus sp. MUM 13]
MNGYVPKTHFDLAMYIVAEQRLGLPQTSRDAFDMLHAALIIDEHTVKRLKAMDASQVLCILSMMESCLVKSFRLPASFP